MPIYLKYGGLRGPAKGKYKGWFSLVKLDFGVKQPAPYGSSEGRTLDYWSKLIYVARESDEVSVDVVRAAASNKTASATVEYTRKDEKSKLETVFLRLELSDALIDSYSVSSQDDSPIENWTIRFGSIKYDMLATPGGN